MSPGGIKIKRTVPFDQIEEDVKELRRLKKKHVREAEMAAKAAKELEAQAAEELDRQEAVAVIEENE